MTTQARFAVVSGKDPRELARNLNTAAAAGFTEVRTMVAAHRAEVWAIVEIDDDEEALPAAESDEDLAPAVSRASAPAPTRRTQVVGAGGVVQRPGGGGTAHVVGREAARAQPQNAPSGIATGLEPEDDPHHDPLAPPPKTDGPSTRTTSPAGVRR